MAARHDLSDPERGRHCEGGKLRARDQAYRFPPIETNTLREGMCNNGNLAKRLKRPLLLLAHALLGAEPRDGSSPNGLTRRCRYRDRVVSRTMVARVRFPYHLVHSVVKNAFIHIIIHLACHKFPFT